MRSVKSRNLALIGLTVFIGVCQVAMARSGGGGRSAIRRGTSNYAPASVECVTPDETFFTGPTVIADLADGVSSDGRGPYIQGTDGVVQSRVANAAALSIYSKDSVKKTRTLTVNMNYPVPGGAGVPFGIVTDEQMGSGGGLHTQRYYPRDTAQNMNKLQVGQTVAAAQMNVTFHINGRLHLLQMGPQPNGHCHGATLVNGTGTSSGTIYRASQTKWVVDLPARSVGRLFDVSNTPEHAVDKGLYYVRLHYEIGN